MVHSNKNTLSPRAYTLVELIVVIAILVVLSTVGFVGYSQYTASSRDGARVSDLRAIYQGIGVSISQKGIAPAPDSSISIYASTGVLLSLQGSVGETVRQAIGLESGGRDPQDGVGYTYLRFKDKKSVQLLAMFEAEEMGAKIALGENGVLGESAYAATDYTDRYPSAFGKKLWVLVESGTNTPLQEVSSYTASGVNLGLPSIASGTGILVVGNTGSGVSENLSGTGVLARVLSPTSLVVAATTTTFLVRYPGCDTDDIILSNGQRWAACNVGGATPTTLDNWLYQWGRNKNVSGQPARSAPIAAADDTDDSFIQGSYGGADDWLSPANNNLWWGATTTLTTGTFNTVSAGDKVLMRWPCAQGYHVPTFLEWCEGIKAAGGWASCTDNLNTALTTLKITPTNSYRHGKTGWFYAPTNFMLFQTSSPGPTAPASYGWSFSLANMDTSATATLGDAWRVDGYAVRCMQD